MKKKVSMKYLLQHADKEALERIARDYPAPETRKKELFPDYIDSETFEAEPIKHSIQWSSVISVAAVSALIVGNGLLFTNLPRVQKQEHQQKAEKAETMQTNADSPAESLTETQSSTEKENYQTTAVYNVSEKTTVIAGTVPAVTETVSEKTETETAKTTKAAKTTKTTETETVSSAPKQSSIEKSQTVPAVQALEVPVTETPSEEPEKETIPAPAAPEVPIPGFKIVYTNTKMGTGQLVYQIQPENSVYYNKADIKYRLSFVPEGLTLQSFGDFDNGVECSYSGNNQQLLGFSQTPSGDFEDYVEFNSLEILNQTVTPVTVSGNYGYTYQKNDVSYLVWVNNDCQFRIIAIGISETEVMQLAETIEAMPKFDISGYLMRYQQIEGTQDCEYRIFPADTLNSDRYQGTPEWYQPVVIPDGFTINTSYGSDHGATERELLYDKNGQNAIAFSQCMKEVGVCVVEEENIQNIREISINGQDGYILTYPNHDAGLMQTLFGGNYQPQNCTLLVWNNGKYVFKLKGEDVTEEELIRMAESLDFEYFPRYLGGMQNIDYEKMMEENPFPNKNNPYETEEETKVIGFFD